MSTPTTQPTDYITRKELQEELAASEVRLKNELGTMIGELISDALRLISARFDQVDARLDRLEARMDKLEERMDRLEERMDRSEARHNKDERKLHNTIERVDKHDLFIGNVRQAVKISP